MGIVVMPLLALVALIHGAFGVRGAIHLWKGFKLATCRRDIVQTSMIAAVSFALTVAAWGWGTTQFHRDILAFMVGFGFLFMALAANYFLLPMFFYRFRPYVFHGVKAGTGLAIPAATMFYMIYMFYLPH